MIGWYNGWSPQERLATVPVQREAVRSGRLARLTTCSICGTMPGPGSDNGVWLHDEDYSRPLAGYAVCRCCHRALHLRFEAPDAWRALVAQHGTGRRWFEQLTLDPASLKRPFASTYPDGLPSS